MDPINGIVNELDRFLAELNLLRGSIQNNTSSGASTIVSKLTTIINGMEKLKTRCVMENITRCGNNPLSSD